MTEANDKIVERIVAFLQGMLREGYDPAHVHIALLSSGMTALYQQGYSREQILQICQQWDPQKLERETNPRLN